MHQPPPLPYVLTASTTPVRGPVEALLVFALGCAAIALGAVYWLMWGPIATAILWTVMVVVFITAWVLLARRRLVVDDDCISHRGGLGRTTRLAPRDITSVAFFERYAEGIHGLRPRIIITRADRGRPLQIDSPFLGAAGPHPLLQALVAIGVRVDYYPAPIDSPTLARVFPEHATFVERHRWAVALSVAGIALAVTVVVVALLVLAQL